MLLQSIGFALGGEAGSEMTASCGCMTSPDTLLRVVAAVSPEPRGAPRVLGVDDWSWRRGVTFGTILVDLKRQRVIDLLPDRTVATFVAWLRAHPGIQNICRDRGPLYAEGAKLGAPQAQQVVDRFHLIRNWGEMLERICIRHRTRLYWTEWVVPAPAPVYTPLPAIVLQARPADDARKQRVRTERLARYEAIRTLAAKGICCNEVARTLHVHWKTVQKYATAETFPEAAPYPSRPSNLALYEMYLRQRWEEGCHDGVRLHREIVAQGYPGSRHMVANLVAYWRKQDKRALQVQQQCPHEVKHPLTPHQFAHLLICPEEERTCEQTMALTQLGERHQDFAQAAHFTARFVHMVRERRDQEDLEGWMQDALQCKTPEVRKFAQKMRNDQAAILAGLTLEWSSGQVEGQVNRLKLLKRQIFGRAGFLLLRQRVLHAV